MDVDFALIGHQESWRAAADVLAVLRGPERTRLPDDEIRDILPWIPPRAVCHVEVGSIFDTKIGEITIQDRRCESARSLHRFLHSSRPSGSRLRAREHRPRSSGGGLRDQGRSEDRESRRIQLHSDRGQLRSASRETRYGLHHRQHVDGWFHRSGHQEDVRARGSEPPQLNAADRRSNRRCGFRLRALFSASREARAAQRTQRGAATQARSGVARPMEFRWRSRQICEQFSAEADLVICAASLASPFASVGPHRARRNRLRCGLSEELVSKRADAWRQNFLRRSGTDHWRIELHAGFSWNSEPASLPRCGPWMPARRHGSRSGAPVRTVLSGKRVHHSGAGRGDRGNRCAARHLSRTALQRRRTGAGRASAPDRIPSSFLFLRAAWRKCRELRRPYGVAYLLSTEAWKD